VTARIPPVLRPEHPLARPLAGLVSEFGLDSRGSLDGVEITGVTLRSTEVESGDLYVGIQGLHSHGAQYAAEAAASGAVAVLTTWPERSSRRTADFRS
jgi:UDP-N-acetylmuramoyl-L-alanyl-D-glutamate--2,6-diaminopimelate ligase